MSAYAATVWGAYLALVLGAFVRNRVFGVFAIVILMFPAGVGLALRDHLGWLAPAVPYFQVAAAVQIVTLMWRPRMKPWPVRLVLSWPASWFIAATFLAFPWGIAAALGLTPYGAWVPFVLATFGLAQSLWTREETVDLRLRTERDAGPLRRFTEGRGAPTQAEGAEPTRRPLTLVQITDPHLGAFMSVERLRRICQRAVEREPDLILLTGDLMTMESHDLEVVSRALEPLRAYEGRVFACHGNHDHEAREVVRIAYERNGVKLLVDDSAVVDTAAGPVQIVGSDFVWGKRRSAHLQTLCDEHPRVPGALRLVLLHDPGAFAHLPHGEGDLVLSGHTHGGQMGLVSLGASGTVVSALSKVPDHGPWARGRDRLYVHRAQGHYGFPIRLGVPAEQSLLRVWA